MFFKRAPRTRTISKKIRVPKLDQKKASIRRKVSAWIGKKRHKEKYGKLKHAKESQVSQNKSSLTDLSVKTKPKTKSKICDGDGERPLYQPNHDRKNQMIFDEIHPQQDIVYPVCNEVVSKAQCMIDHDAINLTPFDSSIEGVISNVSDVQDVSHVTHNIHINHYQLRSKEKNNASNRGELSLYNGEGKSVKDMIVSSSNENEMYLLNNIRPTDIARNEGATATHKSERQQTDRGRTMSLVKSDVNENQFFNKSYEIQQPKNIAPTLYADKNHWQNEAFLVVSSEASFQSKGKRKVLNDETVTLTSTSADIDYDNMGYSFEIELDAQSLVESDLDEDSSIDESCVTEEGSCISIAPRHLFYAFFNAMSIFFNHIFQKMLDVDQYLNIDTKQKKELIRNHRAISHTHRRNRVFGSLLAFSRVIFAYNFIVQLVGQEYTGNNARTRRFT